MMEAKMKIYTVSLRTALDHSHKLQIHLKVIASALLLIASTGVLANSFQSEIGAGYERFEFGAFEADTFFLQAELHFTRVDARAHPLAEAAFLERSSNIFALAGFTEVEFLGFEEDVTTYGGGVEYYVPGGLFYVAGSVLRFDNGISETDWTLTAGLTPMDGLRLRLGYEDLGEIWVLDGKYVVPLRRTNALNLEAAARFGDDDTSYEANVDYYFNRRVSLGGGLAYLDPDMGSSDTQLTLRSRMFFTDMFSGSAFYMFADDTDSWGLAISVRF
jgi:hypothetical protein